MIEILSCKHDMKPWILFIIDTATILALDKITFKKRIKQQQEHTWYYFYYYYGLSRGAVHCLWVIFSLIPRLLGYFVFQKLQNFSLAVVESN